MSYRAAFSTLRAALVTDRANAITERALSNVRGTKYAALLDRLIDSIDAVLAFSTDGTVGSPAGEPDIVAPGEGGHGGYVHFIGDGSVFNPRVEVTEPDGPEHASLHS